MAAPHLVQRCATLSEALTHLNAQRQVRHWSVGYEHSSPDLTRANETLFYNHLLPVLARDHGVRHCVLETLPSDFSSEAAHALMDGSVRIAADRFAEQVQNAQLLNEYAEFTAQHDGPTLESQSPLFVLGMLISASNVLFHLFARVQELAREYGIRVMLSGAHVRWHDYVQGGPLLLTALIDSWVRWITDRLAATSVTSLQRGEVVATLSGALHNIAPDQRPAGFFGHDTAALWNDTILKPSFIERWGLQTFCAIRVVFPEMRSLDKPTPKVCPVVQAYDLDLLRTYIDDQCWTIKQGPLDPWTAIIAPRSVYHSLLAEAPPAFVRFPRRDCYRHLSDWLQSQGIRGL